MTASSRYAPAALALLLALAARAQEPAPGYRPLAYTLPAPGSYRLPPIKEAADGDVLDEQGRALRLHRLLDGKIVLLSFIYATCSDSNGCPLATQVLHQVGKRLAREPDVAARLRLVTVSFDPQHDTPEAMGRYAESFQDGLDWRFITTGNDAALQPILAAYGQAAERIYDQQGRDTGAFAHVLRVYLIDGWRRVRNMYNVSTLQADVLVNDIRTLLLEESGSTPAAAIRLPRPSGEGWGEGSSNTAATLLHWAKRPPLGLPPLPLSKDAPLTAATIALGRKLFYDRRLSFNNTVSCAMCHVPGQGFTSNETATSVGIEGRTVRRNAPTLFNVAYQQSLFHDGRETTLEQQVWGPLLAANEMGNPSIGRVLEKIKALADYAGLFESAFRRGPTMDTLGQALAAYERTLNAADSPFDRWRYGRQLDAVSPQAQQGFELFTGKAGCAACHSLDEKAALFTDHGFHDTGIGYRTSLGETVQPVQLAPGLTVRMDPRRLASVSEAKPNDLGRYEITQDPADRWKYKTPSLRNVALTAPYMHDGSLRTLKEAVAFYSRGGVAHDGLDPLLRPLQLTEDEMDALVAFLESLTGGNAEELMKDGQAAGVGDPR